MNADIALNSISHSKYHSSLYNGVKTSRNYSIITIKSILRISYILIELAIRFKI
jgi:hypothetical protein